MEDTHTASQELQAVPVEEPKTEKMAGSELQAEAVAAELHHSAEPIYCEHRSDRELEQQTVYRCHSGQCLCSVELSSSVLP